MLLSNLTSSPLYARTFTGNHASTFRSTLSLEPALYAVAAAGLSFALMQTSDAWDLLELFYALLVAPSVGLVVIVVSLVCFSRKRPRLGAALLLSVVTYGMSCWLLLKLCDDQVHARYLWALHSKKYKEMVLAQGTPAQGNLSHMYWDGWGFAGMDTNAYLVYDPVNSLSRRDPHTGRFGLLQCNVWKVHQLENHWYSVVFYTNDGWDTTCDVTKP